ncbi:Chanoclavine-I aldehyde reductase fgaOx3 [Psilocybe cubensis]|uniref:NADH:flavin oxidoreductase/NADH oxidase N-terminal domain-containing protein n=2 Tax=Psilocybe cubensis TaxID=181762 RepID=A0A8H8CKQ5_PSICU|nr:Chanoclavine-I aldehyde reductase fgaOx3 [Psilocybe cubensis]KAH9478662.1 Chanoclavine-I aldehyde reductase fgaOx3 [Psilocybe cubensis]
MVYPTLFQPIKVGNNVLQHRVVLAPLTRLKSTEKAHVPTVGLMKTYYSQRSSHPGSLLISEATLIAPQTGGYDHVPGIWNQEQIKAWKQITEAVHANGSYIFLQLWALGRGGEFRIREADGYETVGPSAIQKQPLSVAEIHEYIEWYAQAAKNAREAGFDGVEFHNANGYLPDQFLQDLSNQRTDEYGGSIEGRSRFGLEAIDAIVKAVGAEKVGIRLSPWKTFQSMGMTDPIPQFSHFVKSLADSHPGLAYLHVIEPDTVTRSNDFLREIWSPRPFISTGRHNRESAIERSEKSDDLIGFGRWYISNPDLPTRLMNDTPLAPYRNETFYVPVKYDSTGKGYIDFPFAHDYGQHTVTEVRQQ